MIINIVVKIAVIYIKFNIFFVSVVINGLPELISVLFQRTNTILYSSCQERQRNCVKSWMPHILCNKGTACQLSALLSLFRLEDPNPTVVNCIKDPIFLCCVI